MMISPPLLPSPPKQKQNNNKTKRGLTYNLECKSNLNTIHIAIEFRKLDLGTETKYLFVWQVVIFNQRDALKLHVSIIIFYYWDKLAELRAPLFWMPTNRRLRTL